MMANSWSADVPISMPQPSAHDVLVPMFGFGYNQFGISHDINEVDYMNLRRPAQAPDVDPAHVIEDDAHLDDEGAFL